MCILRLSGSVEAGAREQTGLEWTPETADCTFQNLLVWWSYLSKESSSACETKQESNSCVKEESPSGVWTLDEPWTCLTSLLSPLVLGPWSQWTSSSRWQLTEENSSADWETNSSALNCEFLIFSQFYFFLFMFRLCQRKLTVRKLLEMTVFEESNDCLCLWINNYCQEWVILETSR